MNRVDCGIEGVASGIPLPAKGHDWRELQVHPVANIFPMMPEPDFQSFKGDIAAHGQREPIVVDQQGRILDGRNRYRACRELGIEAQRRTWDGDGSDIAVAHFIMSLNFHRLHLTEAQRAMAAARFSRNVLEPAAKARMQSGKALDPVANLPEGSNDPMIAALRVGRSRDIAAKVFKVSPRSAQDGIAVLDSEVAKLAAQVDQNKLPVSVAAEFARRLKNPSAGVIPEGATAELLVADAAWVRKKVNEAKFKNPDGPRAARASVRTRAQRLLKDLLDVVRQKQDLDDDLRQRLADACDCASNELRLDDNRAAA